MNKLRRFLVVMVSLMILSGVMPAHADDAWPEIKILAYNVWGIYNAKFREERMAEIAKAIVELDPDVAILIEAFEEPHREILLQGLESLGSSLSNIRYFPNADYGSGIFVLSRYPVIRDELVSFRVYVPPGRGEEKMGKSVAILRVRTPYGDILVVGLHALSRTMFARIGRGIIQTDARKCARLLQMYEIAKTLDEKQKQEKVNAVVAGGDFNVFPGLLEYELLMALSGFANAYDKVHPGENEPTFSSENPFTLIPLKWMDQRIDHLIYANFSGRDGPGLVPMDARVVMKQTFEGPSGKQINLSDHYGIFARFAVDKDAQVLKHAPISARAEVSRDEEDWLIAELKEGRPDFRKNPELWTRFALSVLKTKDEEIIYKSRAVKAAAKIILQVHGNGGFKLNLRDRKALRDFLKEKHS
jgi:endonuclease/exonuclease/phosphatase family metal-dependent hydrolase